MSILIFYGIAGWKFDGFSTSGYDIDSALFPGKHLYAYSEFFAHSIR